MATCGMSDKLRFSCVHIILPQSTREHGVGLLSSRAHSAPLVWGNDPEVTSEAPQQNRT